MNNLEQKTAISFVIDANSQKLAKGDIRTHTILQS